jgi:hypothetical protein
MAEIFDLAVTDGNNTGRFPEGQAPSTVNNGARALEGILARGFRDTIIPDRTTTGSANAQVLTPNETIAALAAGMSQTWKAGYTNTGAMTLNVAATGAKPVKMTNGADPYAGAVTAGGYYRTVYDGTNHILMNPSPLAQPGPASTTQSGIVELATDAETQSLSDATRAVTSSNLGALAASTTQRGIVELATDAEARAKSDTGRALVPSNLAAIIYKSATGTALNTLTGSFLRQNHGLGGVPHSWRAVAQCTSTDLGYPVGTIVDLATCIAASSYPAATVWANSTQVGAEFSTTVYMVPYGGGAVLQANTAKWSVYLECSLV